jgi:hypothetical protein
MRKSSKRDFETTESDSILRSFLISTFCFDDDDDDDNVDGNIMKKHFSLLCMLIQISKNSLTHTY